MRSGVGHFNIFPLHPVPKGTAPKLPYRRRDYYKVMLVIGPIDFQYADRIVSVNRQALVFSNPKIPYTCDHLDQIRGGYYCLFNDQFFKNYGKLPEYGVFQPTGTHVFELCDKEKESIQGTYQKMLKELDSDYVHKYDVLRNYVFELLHFALKKQPAPKHDEKPTTASQKIAALFLELLERQFPIEENHPRVELRAPSDFARQLNVHVNHLNRAVKEMTDKTTSEIIQARILREAKSLIKHSGWNISVIAYALGFTAPSHFNNFFKKHTELSPSKFRTQFS